MGGGEGVKEYGLHCLLQARWPFDVCFAASAESTKQASQARKPVEARSGVAPLDTCLSQAAHHSSS